MPSIIPAELIIENVSVITMDPHRPFATGVAIANGKIVGLLSKSGERWPLSPGGQYFDGGGMTLIPGLIDAHCHLRAQVSHDLAVSCRPEETKSIDEIIIAIRNRANLFPDGTWIRGTGYDPFFLKEKRHPNRWDLDKATTNHPVRLRHITRHASVLNSKALDLAGIGPFSSDPPGVKVEREPLTKIPTGIVYGADSWLSQHIIPPINFSELQQGALLLQNKLNRLGITAVQDATPTNTQFDLEFWASRIQDHHCPLMIQLMSGEENHEVMDRFLTTQVPREISQRLQMGPIKVVLEENPDLFPTPQELSHIAARATRRNLPLAIHVVTPEMVWSALEAIRSVSENQPVRHIRHRFEHLSLCPEFFLPVIAELGIIVVTNPSLIYDHGDRYLAQVDGSEHDWLYRMKSLLTEKIPLAAGSDAPVASFNPWIGIQAACTRKSSTCKSLNTKEKLGRWEALEMYTTGAALAANWQNSRGMIRPGYQADFVLLKQNPLLCSIDTLGNMEVYATYTSGNLVFKK